MGEVFLADQLGPRGPVRPVALKRVLPRFVEDDAAVELFLSEMQTAAQLNHPNIATTYDFGEVDGVFFMTMEYVDGVTLDRLLAHHTRIAIPCALAIVGAICDALAHAHALGLVHQDVTPHNVMVSRTGAVKLLDFGIARAEAAVLKAGVRAKIAYAAPEQLEGRAPDRRFDLWSLGVVLYEAIAGQRPFAEGDPNKVLALAKARRYLPLAGLVADAEDVVPVVDGALQPDPDHRWLSAEALGAAVRTASARRAAATERDLAALVAPVLAAAEKPDLSETSATGVAAIDRAALAALEGGTTAPPISETATTAPPGGPERTGAIVAAAGVSSGGRAWVAVALVVALVAGVAWFVRQPVESGPTVALRVEAPRIDPEPDTDESPGDVLAAARTRALQETDAAAGPAATPDAERAEATQEHEAAAPAEHSSVEKKRRRKSPRRRTPRRADASPPPGAARIASAPPADEAGAALDAPEGSGRSDSPTPRASEVRRSPDATEAERQSASSASGPQVGSLGLLSVRSIPWARVALDGRAIGEGVIAKRPVSTGRHVLTLRPGEGAYETKSVTFEIHPGVTTKIFADLRTGTVRVEP